MDYFYRLSPRQFANIVKGFCKREENKSRESWVQVRKIMFASIMPYNKDNVPEEKLFRLPWETVDEGNSQLESDYLEKIEASKKHWERIDQLEKKPA